MFRDSYGAGRRALLLGLAIVGVLAFAAQTQAATITLAPAGSHAVTARVVAARPVRLTGGAAPLTVPASRSGVLVQAAGLHGLRIVAPAGTRVQVRDLLLTSASTPDLLVQRLAWLRGATPAKEIPGGSSDRGTLRTAGDWRRGFFAGALWNAYARLRLPLLKTWAQAATQQVQALPQERSHDAGFVAQESSLAAYRAVCTTTAARKTANCRGYERAALAAADQLVALSQTNAAGLIPTVAAARPCPAAVTCPSGRSRTVIVDSAMNLGVLLWAAAHTGTATYRDLAARQAAFIAVTLLGPDGATTQIAYLDGQSGALLGTAPQADTPAGATWTRGQAWAVYGLTVAGRQLADASLVQAAERAATFLQARLPATGLTPDKSGDLATGLTPYELGGPTNTPPDTSAAAIAAAGVQRLADALCAPPMAAADCARAPRWRSFATDLTARALRATSTNTPLGRFGDQTYTWHNGVRVGGEFLFGTDYLLEALAGQPSAPR